MTPDQPVIAILGPTAVGKTELSLCLAERLNGEIVSVDSRLIYRGMDIGTAKPSDAERSGIPHHLIDVAEPDESWSLATFRQAALRAMNAIHGRGRLPFLVGGTGQYLTAILEGWSPPVLPADRAFGASSSPSPPSTGWRPFIAGCSKSIRRRRAGSTPAMYGASSGLWRSAR